jgi:hypothetical protein
LKSKNYGKSPARQKHLRLPNDTSCQKSRPATRGGFFVFRRVAPLLHYHPGTCTLLSPIGNLSFCLSPQGYGKGNHRDFLRDYLAGKGNIYHGKGNLLFCLSQQASGIGNHRDFLRDYFAGKGNIYHGKGNLLSFQCRKASGKMAKTAESGVKRGFELFFINKLIENISKLYRFLSGKLYILFSTSFSFRVTLSISP